MAYGQLGQLVFEGRLLERGVEGLVDASLVVGGHKLGDPLPFRTSINQLAIGMLDPDNRHPRSPGPVNGNGNVTDNAISLPRARHHTDLDINDNQRTPASFANRGHDLSLSHRNSEHSRL